MKPYLISKDFDLQRLYDSAEKAVFDSNNLALYVQNPNPSIPANNGIGVLVDAISCVVTHQLNGEDEMQMTYPITGQLFDAIEPRAVIVADVERTRGNQPYRIYRITKPINGKVTIYARHLAYDLQGIVVEPFTASTIQAALSGLKTHAMTLNPFTFSTTRTTASTFRVNVPTSVWDLMGGQQGSLLDVYGGEYTFDGYNITLENRVGADNGVSVRYGVNMTDLTQDENVASCYTGVVAYWANEEDGVVYSPVMSATGTYGYVKILSVDMSDKWENKPTVAQLKSAAATYITANEIGVPKVSWTVGFVPLDTTEEYKDLAVLERVSIGDTVTVKFERLGVDASARVNKIVWDVLQDRYDSVSLGSVKANIADTIAAQAREIANIPTKNEVKSLATQISTALTNAILGAQGGSVRLLDTDDDGEPDTLYIADNPDPAQAVKVWRWNYEGWGASSNGYDGPFVMGATLDGGLMADFITAGVLNANLIKVISSGDVGSGYGACNSEFNGQFIQGSQVASQKPLWKLGSVVSQAGEDLYVHGDLKIYAVGDGMDDSTPVIWIGGTGNSFGIVLNDPYSNFHGQLSIATGEDIGPSIFLKDDDGHQVFSLGGTGYTTYRSADGNHSITINNSDGSIYCDRLFVNGTEITP